MDFYGAMKYAYEHKNDIVTRDTKTEGGGTIQLKYDGHVLYRCIDGITLEASWFSSEDLGSNWSPATEISIPMSNRGELEDIYKSIRYRYILTSSDIACAEMSLIKNIFGLIGFTSEELNTLDYEVLDYANQCNFCGGTISVYNVRCPHCGESSPHRPNTWDKSC
jgi:hypothetical protein